MASYTKDLTKGLVDALSPNLNEDRALLLAMVLLVFFTLTFLGLAVIFKVLCRYKWIADDSDPAAAAEVASYKERLVAKMSGWSDLELQGLLQSSSATAGLIFTVVGFLAPFVEREDRQHNLARVLVGLVALGNQVVLFTWIYVETWGGFTNSLILTGTLTTAAFATRGIGSGSGGTDMNTTKCKGFGCFENAWERILMNAMFYFILLTALLNVILAAGPLLGLFNNISARKRIARLYNTLDAHLRCMVDLPVEETSNLKRKPVSEALVGEIVKKCMEPPYLKEMHERVYGGQRSTELRVVLAAVPTVVLAAAGMWLKKDWRWAGAAAAALLAASWSAIFFGFVCVRQRENRLPLFFSRGNDIHESFENATSDLFGMNRKDFYKRTWAQDSFKSNDDIGFIQTLKTSTEGGCLEIHWETCNFMVIQTLGLTELGHFEEEEEEEKGMNKGKVKNKGEEKEGVFRDPNSNTALINITRIPKDQDGLETRRNLILRALRKRDPVKIGPTAISKIAGVIMALKNAIHCMNEGMICTQDGSC